MEQDKEDNQFAQEQANKNVMKVLAEEQMKEVETYNRNREFANYQLKQKVWIVPNW